MPVDVFISYSRKDSEFVSKLSESLTNRGIQVWIDQGGIIAGDTWRRQIVEAIRDCRVFLLVLSPNSALSDNVVKELSMAESNRRKIIPVLFQPVDIPQQMEYQLSGLKYQAFDSGDYATNLNRLLQALAQLGIEIQPEVIKPIPLPAEIQSAIDSPMTGVRVGIVGELSRILNGRNVGLALSAQEALKQLSSDDSRRVANSAKQVLQEYAARTQEQEAQAEKERLAREKVEQENLEQQRAEAERLERKKAEQEKLARDKAEAERIAQEQAEATRLAVEKEKQGRLATEKSKPTIAAPSSKSSVTAKSASRSMKAPLLIGGGIVGIIAICLCIAIALLIQTSTPLPVTRTAIASSSGQSTLTPQPANVPPPSTPVPLTATPLPLKVSTDTLVPPPTNIPLPPSVTAIATPTAMNTPTRTATPTATTPPTPALAPGIYVVTIQTIPSNPTLGFPVSFKVTFLNTTNAPQNNTWRIRIYEVDGKPNSLGDVQMRGEISVGNKELQSNDWPNTKVCERLYTRIYLVDPEGKNDVQPPLTWANGRGEAVYNFSTCP